MASANGVGNEQSTYEVAIIGYGPTSMVLAGLLGKLKHRVLVLERYDGLYNLPRAACFDDEAMRIFQKLGVTEGILRSAVVQRDYDWVNGNGETLVQLAYDDHAAGGWAALYMMFQPYVEDVLDRLVKSLPTVKVLQGTTVNGIEQTADDVTITAVRKDEEVRFRARYVVGADGGGGFTRSHLTDALDDYDFQENWLVCDFRMLKPVPGLPDFRQLCDPRQPTAIVRIGPEHHRFSFMLDWNEDRKAATAPERVWERVSAYLNRDNSELIRVANYVFRSRIAARWRMGRVLLAGDAAHEMPPFLAQGMCSGMRDSHNLAWKLDLILSGKAADDILDTYQPEREPHVRFITEKAIELGRVQTMRDPVAAAARDERLLALRGANKAPEKLKFPALNGGLIHDSGAFFPQGNIRTPAGLGRMDDVIGDGWLIVAKDAAIVDKLSYADRSKWQSLGGRILGLGGGHVEDGDVMSKWLDTRACTAAIVRPDWYVFGTANTPQELGQRIAELINGLGPMREEVEAQ